MSLGMMDADVMDRFDGICATVAARGRGLTLQQIGDAGALARLLAQGTPTGPLDHSTAATVPELAQLLRTRLGLEDGDNPPPQ